MNKQELLKKFGKNVKIERIKKDLTQEQLSEILDVNQNYIACIECGRQNMSLGKILEQPNENKFIVVANYNCSVQTVISGQEDAIDEAMETLKAQGAKRAIKLNTSGPFHTIKLEKAKEAYEKELVNIDFHLDTKVKVIKNIDGTYYAENDNIKEILTNHIISPVRFDKAIKLMEQEQVEEYLEIGPGRTLTGFVKKDNKEAKTFNINNVDSLEKYLEEQV